MKEVFFIYPNPNKTNPRGIRINNVVKNIQQIAPENNYSVLSFSNSLKPWSNNKSSKVNMFNLIFLLFKYMGIFRLVRKFSKLSRVLDSYILIHFLIKLDLKLRLQKVKNFKKVVFVVVVSPFSNYLMVPWLRKKYPDSKIVCDIGDPLYKNTARWNDDHFSKSIELKALKDSSSIIVTNNLTKVHFEKEYLVNDMKINIIPQGVDVNLIERATNCVNPQKYTLAYAGRFYKELRSPEELYKALNSQNKYTLNIYGNNDSRNIKNVNFKGRFSQNNLFKELAKNEILVFIDNKSGIQTSGKIYELLAFRKILLFIEGDEKSPTLDLALKYSNVFFCKNDKDSILSILDLLDGNDIKIDYFKSKEFSWENRSVKYLNILKK